MFGDIENFPLGIVQRPYDQLRRRRVQGTSEDARLLIGSAVALRARHEIGLHARNQVGVVHRKRVVNLCCAFPDRSFDGFTGQPLFETAGWLISIGVDKTRQSDSQPSGRKNDYGEDHAPDEFPHDDSG